MIGTRLSTYEVLAELGSGGMGTVYLGEVVEAAVGLDESTKVALKVIHPNLLSEAGFFKRFLREAQIGQTVQHENVVRTYDCDATLVDGRQQNFLVMEYVEGRTLRLLLTELERVPEELCRHIGREIAKGLSAIHDAGVVHRDLKPENVLITEQHVVKVMDLGVARLKDEAIRLSQAGSFVGSLEYAAPEQFQHAQGEADGRADLHALGVLLYELSTGQHPYRDEDTSKLLRNILDEEPRKAGEVNPQLSPFFEEVIHTLMAKDREQRFPAAADLVAVLRDGEVSDWWKARATALRMETKQPLRRIRVPRETALYGRKDELARLHALFDEAQSGDGQVLLLEGEAGIGKTRLVDEFVGHLRQAGEDINFLFGSYPPGGAATASGAFSTAYRMQFGGATLEQTLGGYLTETPLLIPAFAALLRGDATPTGAVPLTQDSLQTVFVHATRALASERTTIVLIDDMHFSPQGGRALFASLALAVPGHRILLVGASRPGQPDEWGANLERHAHVARARLPRLGAKDLAELLQDAFRSERLAQELGHQVAVKSDGNPFFAFEIIRGLREGQFIAQTPEGAWISTQVIKDIQIPSTVMDLIQARISDLADEDKNLLDLAACCGFQFDPLIVGRVLKLEQIPLMQRLARIEQQHRLVRSAGRHFVFDHHQVQEALYEGMPVLLREPYHKGIAEALEEREGALERDPSDLDGQVAVDICEHFLGAGSGMQALRYLRASLDHLEHGYLNEDAIDLADRALGVPDLLTGEDRLDVLLRKNERLDLLGRRAEQQSALDEALVLADAAGATTARAQVERGLGMLRWRTGHPEEAREHFGRWLAMARESGDREAEARATGRLGVVLRSQGAHAEAREHYQRSIAIAREIGDRIHEARATGNLGVICFTEGVYDDARRHYQRARELFQEVGDRQGEITSTGNLGLVLQAQGAIGDALKHYERFISAAREVGDRQGEAVAEANCGMLLHSVGAFDEAHEHLSRFLEISHEIGYRRGVGHGLHSQALAAEQRGDSAEAERLLGESLTLRREIGQRDALAATLMSMGALFAGQGRADEAAPLLTEAIELARGVGVAGTEVLGACHLARIRPATLPRALETFASKRARLRQDELVDASFVLWSSTGDAVHLDRAKRLLDELVEGTPEKYRRALLEDVVRSREIMNAWEEHGSQRPGSAGG